MVEGEKKESLFDLEPSQLSQVLPAVVLSGKAFISPANASLRELLTPSSECWFCNCLTKGLPSTFGDEVFKD